MASKNTTKYLSNKQEKRVAKDIGGRVVIASGSLWFASSDCRSEDYLIECKTTQKNSYRLTAETWEKITAEAINDGLRVPIMCIEVSGSMKAVVDKSHFSDEPHFQEIVEHLPINDCKDVKSFLVDKNNQIMKINTKLNQYSLTFKQRCLCVIDWEDFLEIIRSE